MEELARIIDLFIGWIPNLIGAILILIIGWVIAWILKFVVKGSLKRTRLDRRIEESPKDSFIRKISDSPSSSIANFIYWLVLIITWTMVIAALKIPILTELVYRIYGYVPNLLAAIVIILLALAFSGLVSGVIMRWMGDTRTGRLMSTIIPGIILIISGFAVLEQLGIAPVIISTTYIAIIGSFALAFGLAFGLGGREVASSIWQQIYEKGASSYEQMQKDVNKGKERAQADIDRVKNKYY